MKLYPNDARKRIYKLKSSEQAVKSRPEENMLEIEKL